MTRKLSTDQEGAARVLSLRLPPALADALDAEALRRAEAAGVPVTAAAVARVLLERALLGATTSTTRPTPATTAQEAAQGTTTSRTTARPRRRREAAATPPSASPKADDEQHTERQLPLLGEGAAQNDHDRRNAEQAALLDAHDDGHARRNAEHTAAAALRAEIAALGMSSRAIGEAMSAAGFPLTGRAVSQFVSGHTAGMPRWADKFRAWRASVSQGSRA